MCGIRQWDGKTRRIYAAGNVFLLAGLIPTLFGGGPWSLHHRALYDGLRGLCLGLAIGLLLWVVRRKSQCGPMAGGKA